MEQVVKDVPSNNETIYFGTLSSIEKLNMIRLWLLINAFKQESTHLESNTEMDTLSTKSYLKSFILEGISKKS